MTAALFRLTSLTAAVALAATAAVTVAPSADAATCRATPTLLPKTPSVLRLDRAMSEAQRPVPNVFANGGADPQTTPGT